MKAIEGTDVIRILARVYDVSMALESSLTLYGTVPTDLYQQAGNAIVAGRERARALRSPVSRDG